MDYTDDDIKRARQKVGNTYLDPSDYRVRVTSIENWGGEESPFWIVMLRYDDGDLEDQPLDYLDECTLIEFGDEPNDLTWVPDREAIDWAYSQGRLFASKVGYEKDPPTEESEARKTFDDLVEIESFGQGRSYDELVEIFDTSSVETTTLVEACIGGFIDSILVGAGWNDRNPPSV